MAYSYYTYQNWDLYPILVTAAICGLLLMLMVVYACYKRTVDNKFLPFAYTVSRIIFRESVKKTELEAGKKQYFIFGYPVTKRVFYTLGLLSINIWQAIFGTFWAVFLIDETFACDEKLDCFPFNISNASNTAGPIQDYPIEDCADFILIDDVEIQCYQFVLNYAEAMGAAGGVLILATLIIEGHVELLLWLLAKLSASDSFLRMICWMITNFIGFLLPYTVAITLFSLGLFEPFFKDIWFKTISSAVMFSSYSATILFSSFFGMYILIDIIGKGSHESEDERRPIVNANEDRELDEP